MASKKPILVTGSHRSGSTWVGKMLSQAPSVSYIREPFDLNWGPGICSADFRYWFTYICEENEAAFQEPLRRTLEFRYNLLGELAEVSSLRDLLHLLDDCIHFSISRLSGARPLMKDPIAVFSAEWLASTFDMDVVVLIRHPAAFVGSLKKGNSTHPFEHFLEQPLLMRDHLQPFEAEIRRFAENEHDVVDQAILLWKLIYYVVDKYRQEHTDWLFVRHEDLSREPVKSFRDLFRRLDIKFSERIEREIRKHTAPENPCDPSEDENPLKRDSRSNIWNWKERLTDSEINRVRSGVSDVARAFYSDADW